MPIPSRFSFVRYLAAKKSVDDRALNRTVLDGLIKALPKASSGSPLKVLEIGAGIGTMVERLLAWQVLASADYTAIDVKPENSAYAMKRLPEWALDNGYKVNSTPAGDLDLEREGCQVKVRFQTMDLFDFARIKETAGRWDLLIAHALLDLLDPSLALPLLLGFLKKQGLFYFTLNFDSATILEPSLDASFDSHVESLYHQSMDDREVEGKKSGDSRTGRHLFTAIPQAGGRLLEAGSSDWVVFPGPQGYPQDEAYFLHYIIHTIHLALFNHPGLEPGRFEAWVAERHAQVERGELAFVAHQLDFLGKRAF